MAAFWSHAAGEPRHGLTIHFVDEGVDTGPIILQREVPGVSPAWSYPRVMRTIMSGAPELFWKAMDLLAAPGFRPGMHSPVDEPRRFPSLEEARRYRERLARRRAGPSGR